MSSSEAFDIDSDDYSLIQGKNFAEKSENSDSESNQGSYTTALNRAARDNLREIYDILECKQEVNYKNALEINQEMLKRLIAVREQIQILQKKIVERYESNKAFLMKNMKVKKNTEQMFGKINRGEKFYIKGSIYFKDENKRNAPNNEDYFERRRNGEMFPMDFELTSRHVWSIRDKLSIIQGIKEQIYDDKILRKRFKDKKLNLEKMLEEVGSNFKIDWVQISVLNLRHRHTPSSAKAMFEVYLHPSLKHDEFSNDENERLAHAAAKFNMQNWAGIAAEVGRRSDYQCFIHYHTTPSFRQPYGRWDKSADELLLKTVEASKCNGVINWSEVCYIFPHKSRVSLHQRYHYFLNPAVSHAPFTGEEDLLLLAAVQEYGKQFSKFPRSLFPNRSIIQLRSRYYNTLATRHKACPWNIEDDRILLKFVEDHGMLWKKCSEIMEQRHTRVSCRQRYMSIQKHMKDNPNFKLEEMPRRPFRMMTTCVTPENWLNKIEELRANPQLSVEETTAPLNIKRSGKRKRQSEVAISLPTTSNSTEPPPKRTKETKKPIYIERLRQCGLLYHNFFKYSYNFRFGKPTQYTPNELYTKESEQAIECLGFQMPSKCELVGPTGQKLGSCINGLYLPAERRLGLTNAISQRVPKGMVLEPNGHRLAPNFSTLIALRALCVLSADVSKQKEELETNNSSLSSGNRHLCNAEVKTEVESEVEDEKEIAEISTAAIVATEVFKHKTLSIEEFNSVPAVNRFRQRFRALFYQAAGISRLPPTSIPNNNLTKSLSSTSPSNSTNSTSLSGVAEPESAAFPATTQNIKQEPELVVDDDSSEFLDFVLK